MSFRNILDQVKDILDGDDNDEQQRRQTQDVLPASQDPLGDPADQEAGYYPANYNNGQTNYNNDGQFDNVLPASQDPLGDPADQENGFGNVLPASEDPLGDPADQEQEQRGGIFPFFRR